MTQVCNLGVSPSAELRSPLDAKGVRSLVQAQKVALVTGGTDGIGRAVALELARGQHRVIFVGRDRARGAEVLAELEAALPGAGHRFLPADLSLLAETTRVADDVMKQTPHLDAAVFCAGILSTIPEWTSEDLERNFVLNYLCRFLLVCRLVPLLQSATSGRIVLVSNAGRYPDTLDFDDLQHRRGKPGLHVSGRTQFANDLLAVELAERLQRTPIRVSCVFPGVTRSSCFRNARGLPWIMRLLAPLLVPLIGHRPAVAARTPSFLAMAPADAATSGGFYGPQLQPLSVPARAQDRERRALLWSASAELVRPFVPHVVPALRGAEPDRATD